jgi:hypothetical protein
MATARADLKATISADSSQFDATMRRAAATSAQAGAKISKGLGGGATAGIRKATAAVAGLNALFKGALVAGIGLGIKKAADLGGALSDVSAQTGIAAGNVAVLRRAFEDAGVGADAVGATINKLQKAIAGANAGSEKSQAVFAKLGVDLAELSKMTPDQQFAAIGAAINKIEDPAQRAAVAMELFGKSGGKLLAVFGDAGALTTAGEFIGTQAEILNRQAGLFDTISDKLGRIPDKLGAFFVGVLDPIAEDLDGVLTRFEETDFAAIGQSVGKMLKEFIPEDLDIGGEIYQAAETIKSLINGISGFFQIMGKLGELIGLLFANIFSPEVWMARFDLLTSAFKGLVEGWQNMLATLFSGETFNRLLKSFFTGGMTETAGEIIRDQMSKGFTSGPSEETKGKLAAAIDANKAIGEEFKTIVDDILSPIKQIEMPEFTRPKVEVKLPEKPIEVKAEEPPKSDGFKGGIAKIPDAENAPITGSWESHLPADQRDKNKKVMEDSQKQAAAAAKGVDVFNQKSQPAISIDERLRQSLIDKEQKRMGERMAGGFSGLGGWSQMQIDKLGGIGPGTNTMLSGGGKGSRWSGIANAEMTGGLGEKRRLRTAKDDRDAKKNLSIQERQVSSLESIEGKISQAITVA